MDTVILIHSILTVVAFGTFIGIFMWAWSAKQRGRFEAAAHSVLEEDEADRPARSTGD